MSTGRVPTTANSPLTTKGDLFGYSTTQARVAVGSDGDTLLADSSATTGLRWSSQPSASNPVINSAMQIWQRGTSIAGSAGSYLYTADRWQTNASTALTVSRQTTSDTTNLPFIQYCARVQRNNGSTATAAAVMSQSFESINSILYAGKTVTLSFYARRGANFSGASNQLEVYLQSGTGTDQNAFVGGFTGAANTIYQTPTLTTTWQRFSYTATVPTTATQLAVQFTYTPAGTAGAADYYEVTGVQLDSGSVALPFRTQGVTLQGEIALAQRYYSKSYAIGTAPATVTNSNNESRMTPDRTDRFALGYSFSYPVVMRSAPTITLYSPATGTAARVRDTGAGADRATTAINIEDSKASLLLDSGVTTTANDAHTWHWVASAEL